MKMRVFLLVTYVLAYHAPSNSIFNHEPSICGYSDSSFRIKYSLNPSILKVKLGTSDLSDITSSLSYYFNSSYYGFSNVPISTPSLSWDITDFSGRTAECITTFEHLSSSPQSNDPCEAKGCHEIILGDDWCDPVCLNEACGYDIEDCEAHDIIGLISCDPASISNLVCNPECNNIIGMFDGGDCSTECAKKGCDLKKLENAVCDIECNIEDCDWDKGDCKNCEKGCREDMISNGSCDRTCNVKECAFDGEDCLQMSCESFGCEISMMFNYECDEKCNVPQCNYDNRICISCNNTDCPVELLGNKLCDEACNILECKYDHGDCIDKHFCKRRNCDFEDLGDGECDLECNHPECQYDLGDCKSMNCAEGCLDVMLGNGVCENQCNNPTCNYDQHDCNDVKCSSECFREFINDGVCDEACNNANCQFDSGDCENLPYKFSENILTLSSKSYKARTICSHDFSPYLLYSIFLSLLLFI